MNTIQIGKANIDIYDQSVGVNMSGGADSSILLYILMKTITKPIHVYSLISKEKNRISMHTSTNVISKCIDLTGNTNVYHHLTYANKQTFSLLQTMPMSDLANKRISVIYTGITSVPPKEVRDTFTVQSGIDNARDPTMQRPLYDDGKIFHMPFTNLNKQDICELYEILNVKKELYPITRSCESYILTEGHCGECWWCQERKWGFGYL
jgi:7-cyano-7-deazaguanine synthase in queuosine biosynthesis